MKTTWISLFGTGLAAMMLTGCSPSAADKAKDNVETNKDAKVDAINKKAELDAERVKKEAELKKDQIDANAKANEAARNQAATNLDAAAEAKRKEADLLEKKADEVKKD